MSPAIPGQPPIRMPAVTPVPQWRFPPGVGGGARGEVLGPAQYPGLTERAVATVDTNADTNADRFRPVQAGSQSPDWASELRICTRTNEPESAAFNWGSRGRRFKSCRPDR